MMRFLRNYRLRVAREKLENYVAQARYWEDVLSSVESISAYVFECQARRLGVIAELRARIERLEQQ